MQSTTAWFVWPVADRVIVTAVVTGVVSAQARKGLQVVTPPISRNNHPINTPTKDVRGNN